jgi:transcriptional regulator with XRE-family HTH domain
MACGTEMLALKKLFELKCLSQHKVAKKMGIHVNSLNNKLNGKSELTRSEMIQLIEILDIDDIKGIFFSRAV